MLNAQISSSLLRTIFFKNTPLHDGAVIIKNNIIVAAGCILPLTQRDVDKTLGLGTGLQLVLRKIPMLLPLLFPKSAVRFLLQLKAIMKRRISREVLD
jgi:diadenylate cyclase